MNTHIHQFNSSLGFFAAAILAVGTTAQSADKPTLKDAYKDHFYVGVAVNRPTMLQAVVRADNVNRTLEQLANDGALVKEQFNQIVPENDTKWQLIHPNEGPDGYDFAPADAFVNFGLSNNMYLVGHTLVWHAQTPNWVFAGTNPPPAVAKFTATWRGCAAPRRCRPRPSPPSHDPGRRTDRCGAESGRRRPRCRRWSAAPAQPAHRTDRRPAPC